MSNENEALGWPTNLDRAGIHERLVQAREAAEKSGLANIVSFLEMVAMNLKNLKANG